MLDFSILTGFENIVLIEVDQNSLACGDTKH